MGGVKRGLVRIALVSACTALTLCAASASTTAPTWWKTDLSTERPGDTRFYAFAAASPRNAWVLGERSGDQDYEPVARHWNGERWRPVRLPRKRMREHGGYEAGTRLSASSDQNAWLLLRGEFRYAYKESGAGCGVADDLLESKRPGRPSRLLRWDGSRWKDSLTVEDAVIGSVVAVGEGEAWAFGEGLEGQVVFHYDGTGWSRKRSPVRVDDAKAYESEVWVVGDSATTRQPGVWRFNGTRWRPVPFGGIHPRSEPITKKKDGRWTSYSTLAVLDGGEIAVSGLVGTASWCIDLGFWHPKESPYQLLWNGVSWERERGHRQDHRRFHLVSQTSDGQGGRYAVGMPITQRGGERSVFLHRSASGHWVDLEFPGWNPIDVFRLPGSRTVQVAGADRVNRELHRGIVARFTPGGRHGSGDLIPRG